MKDGVAFPRTDSSQGFSDLYAERGEAVQDGDTDLKRGNLTVEVPRGQPVARQFQPVHPFAGKTLPRSVFWPGAYFDAALAVATAPASPDGPAEAF